MKKHFLLAATILLVTKILQAQDIHFSQYDAAPLALNVANTGNIDGKFRIATNYRNQWGIVSIPFVAEMISTDFSFLKKKKNFLGVGLLAYRDISGTAGLSNKRLYGSLAYHIHFGKADTPRHYLHIGVQGGWVNKFVDLNKLVWVLQYNPFTSNYSNASLERFASTGELNYFDLNIGAIWSSVISKKVSVEGGINLMHINSPKYGLYVFNYWLQPEVFSEVFHASSQIKVNSLISFSPTFIYVRSTTPDYISFGSTVNLSFKKTTFYQGAYYHLGDAVVLVAGVRLNKIRFGVSYDFNISSLKTASSARGGFELSLAYCPFKSNRQLKFYPKD